MLIKAAINGGRSRADHAGVPLTPGQQAAAVVECLRAGAGAIHLHVRATSGDPKYKESLRPTDVAVTLSEVRALSGAAAIGVSTGAWIVPDVVERFEQVKAWEVLPDFASVNFNEAGAAELAELLLSRNVGVEAGLSGADEAELLINSGLAKQCFRVLIEPQEQRMETALQTVRAIKEVLDAGAVNTPILLHGTEATVWPMMNEAIASGYDVRVGLEDTLVMPDGRIAPGNAQLVMEAVRRVQAAR